MHVLLLHAARQSRSWLIFDVSQESSRCAHMSACEGKAKAMSRMRSLLVFARCVVARLQVKIFGADGGMNFAHCYREKK
jgi:hypothetical protein